MHFLESDSGVGTGIHGTTEVGAQEVSPCLRMLTGVRFGVLKTVETSQAIRFYLKQPTW